jgi:MinD superfamily P-loop ATPase
MTAMQTPPLKQLVILSGKGGTGKTTLSAALIHLASKSRIKTVHGDADVDAANLALVTGAVPAEVHPFKGSSKAMIHPERCTGCGICEQVCRFDAVRAPLEIGRAFEIDVLRCDGCAACVYTCPEAAVQMVLEEDGEWYHSQSDFGRLFHAELHPGAENTGKLVTTVKQNAKLFAEDHRLNLLILDGPPGIGCPVISASAGANLALLVAEPGVSGIHDLKRIIATLQHFNVPALICINKADLYSQGTAEIQTLAKEKGIPVVGEIPFDRDIPRAMVQAQPVTAFAPDGPASKAIRAVWSAIMQNLALEVPS